EDTYRTLTAADSAIMLIDAAKGVEPQTEKLFQVCRLRGIPIFTFVNKMDREGREPLELMEEVEKLLDIHSVPMNWPVGRGSNFRGLVDLRTREVTVFHRGESKEGRADAESMQWDDAKIAALIGRSEM